MALIPNVITRFFSTNIMGDLSDFSVKMRKSKSQRHFKSHNVIGFTINHNQNLKQQRETEHKTYF